SATPLHLTRLIPRSPTALRPTSSPSYSATLLVALKSRRTMYFSVSPVGGLRTTPAPAPLRANEPSKNIVQGAVDAPGSASTSSEGADVHSVTKSASA